MLKEIDLKELSDLSDTRPSFISVYLNAKDNRLEKFINKREKECLNALKGDKELSAEFKKNIQKIRDYVSSAHKSGQAKAYAIFSSSSKDFFKGYELPIELENQLIVDTSPYIRPLAVLEEEWEPFAIVLLDHSNARLFLISSAIISDTKKMHKDIMNKHKKGGWSQMRFQRLRKGAIDHFFKDVAEYLEKFLEQENIRRIVLAGPGSAKKQFREYLPEQINSKVIAEIDEEFDIPEGQLLDRSLDKFFKKELEEENEMVANLRAEILKGGLVIYGLDDTVEAVIGGRAELLLVNMGVKAKGWKCEHCNIFHSGSQKTCPSCGKEVFTVDVVEELVEAAKNMGTTLEFIKDNELLEELGGVAAFLRF